MSLRDLSILEKCEDLRLEPQKSQTVRDGRTILRYTGSPLRLRQSILLDQRLVSSRCYDGSQVIALGILDDGELTARLFIDLFDDHRDFLETGDACCSPATLTSDDLIQCAPLLHHDR